MKIFKKTTYIILLGFLFLMASCGDKKENKSKTSNNSKSETRISTYEIHISGGELDGKTISGSFPNVLDHGGGGYIDQDVSNFSKNEVTLHAKDTVDQEKLIALTGDFVLNDNDQALPLGPGLNNTGEQSTLLISINAIDSFDPESSYSFVSKEGTVSVSDLEVGPNIGGSVYSDYNAEFQGTFRDVKRSNDEIKITGKFHMKSIRDEN